MPVVFLKVEFCKDTVMSYDDNSVNKSNISDIFTDLVNLAEHNWQINFGQKSTQYKKKEMNCKLQTCS